MAIAEWPCTQGGRHRKAEEVKGAGEDGMEEEGAQARSGQEHCSRKAGKEADFPDNRGLHILNNLNHFLMGILLKPFP